MQKFFKLFIGPVTILLFVLSIIASAPSRQTKTVAEKPGFYGIYSSSYWNGGNGDVNGEVGHRLYVNPPTARCVPGGAWNAASIIVSGSLPPGLLLSKSNHAIEGIPTERGHWVVKMKMYDVTCQGSSYNGFEQELRLHITGSGKVN